MSPETRRCLEGLVLFFGGSGSVPYWRLAWDERASAMWQHARKLCDGNTLRAAELVKIWLEGEGGDDAEEVLAAAAL